MPELPTAQQHHTMGEPEHPHETLFESNQVVVLLCRPVRMGI